MNLRKFAGVHSPQLLVPECLMYVTEIENTNSFLRASFNRSSSLIFSSPVMKIARFLMFFEFDDF